MPMKKQKKKLRSRRTSTPRRRNGPNQSWRRVREEKGNQENVEESHTKREESHAKREESLAKREEEDVVKFNYYYKIIVKSIFN